MGFLKSIFGGAKATKTPRGFFLLTIGKIERLTENTVRVELSVPEEQKGEFQFLPGQYLNFSIQRNGKEYRRSYSICSGKNEPLAVAVKQVADGVVSTWFNREAKEGESIFVAPPEGNFTLKEAHQTVVGIAAGSGITPLMSIAKALEGSERKMKLFYGNRRENDIIFRSEIDALHNTTTTYYLTGEEREGFSHGRLGKEAMIAEIKADLALLKSDAFFICGPEEMISSTTEALTFFGVSKEKIHFELFTPPTTSNSEKLSSEAVFDGKAKITVILDDETHKFELEGKGMSILEKANNEGLDAPYSCKGGVCSTCKAKVLKGKASMRLNYSLTDKEVEEGYILTCQAHPTTEELILTYDV